MLINQLWDNRRMCCKGSNFYDGLVPVVIQMKIWIFQDRQYGANNKKNKNMMPWQFIFLKATCFYFFLFWPSIVYLELFSLFRNWVKNNCFCKTTQNPWFLYTPYIICYLYRILEICSTSFLLTTFKFLRYFSMKL